MDAGTAAIDAGVSPMDAGVGRACDGGGCSGPDPHMVILEPGTPRALSIAATKLEWMNPPGTSDVAGALAYCDALVLGGHDDWRLPTIDELRSLIRGCANTVTGGPCGASDTCRSGDRCYGGCTRCDAARWSRP
jgi:hypothetical protein